MDATLSYTGRPDSDRSVARGCEWRTAREARLPLVACMVPALHLLSPQHLGPSAPGISTSTTETFQRAFPGPDAHMVVTANTHTATGTPWQQRRRALLTVQPSGHHMVCQIHSAPAGNTHTGLWTTNIARPVGPPPESERNSGHPRTKGLEPPVPTPDAHNSGTHNQSTVPTYTPSSPTALTNPYSAVPLVPHIV